MSWHHLLALLSHSPSANHPTRMPLRIRGTTNSACSSYGLASTSATIIHFGEGQAETSQARQRLGVSCDLLSAYQVA